MTIGLPNPEGDPTSIRTEFLDVLAEIRKYRAAELPGEIEKMIHDVAMNSEISGKVIAKIKSELPTCRAKFYRISTKLAVMWVALIPLLFIVHLFLRAYVPPRTITAGLWIAIVVILELYILGYFDWRSEHRDSYIANFLIRSLEFGLRYQSTLTDERLRDGLALMIQRTAIRYSIIYKKSDSTRFFGSPYLTGVPPIRPLRPARPDPVGRPYGALAAAPLLVTFRDRLRRGSFLACRAARVVGCSPSSPADAVPARTLYPPPFACLPADAPPGF